MSRYNQTILITFDVEHDTIVRNEARAAVSRLAYASCIPISCCLRAPFDSCSRHPLQRLGWILRVPNEAEQKALLTSPYLPPIIPLPLQLIPCSDALEGQCYHSPERS